VLMSAGNRSIETTGSIPQPSIPGRRPVEDRPGRRVATAIMTATGLLLSLTSAMDMATQVVTVGIVEVTEMVAAVMAAVEEMVVGEAVAAVVAGEVRSA